MSADAIAPGPPRWAWGAAALGLWLLCGIAIAGELEMQAPVAAADVAATAMELGALAVPGIGPVRIVAQRRDKTVTLLATGPAGRLVGQAESVVGVRETLIAVQGPDGLTMVKVTWARC